MPVEEIELTVGDEQYPGRVNVPDDPTGRGVVCLPGAGHGPYGNVFDTLAEAVADEGQYFLRFESWDEPDETGEKTLDQLHAEIDAAIEELESRGCESVALFGKSFGGGIVLTYAPGAADRIVLWAPAIRVGEETTVDSVAGTALADVDGPQVGPGHLAAIEIPVRILHGGEDDVVPIGISQQIVEYLPDGELIELSGGDHSFVGGTVEETAIAETVEFLTE